MRIIGYIDHSFLKVTVFQMDTRITVKFETPEFEQSYKFRMPDQLNHLEDVQRLVDNEFIEMVLDNMKAQNRTKAQAMDRFIQEDTAEEFDTII